MGVNWLERVEFEVDVDLAGELPLVGGEGVCGEERVVCGLSIYYRAASCQKGAVGRGNMGGRVYDLTFVKQMPLDPDYLEITKHLIDAEDPDLNLAENNNWPRIPKHLVTHIKRYLLQDTMLQYFAENSLQILFQNYFAANFFHLLMTKTLQFTTAGNVLPNVLPTIITGPTCIKMSKPTFATVTLANETRLLATFHMVFLTHITSPLL